MKRPVAHITGDIGTKAAAKFFVSLGWASDPVLSDYGEDLILQTTLNGSVDPFRTLVQVRSTRGINKGRLACRISREHALRWKRCTEPVLLVLWDVSEDRGWYTFPAEQYSEYDFLLSGKKSTLVQLDLDDALTSAKGITLGWKLRLDYFRKKMLYAQQRDREHFYFISEDKQAKVKYEKSLGVVVFEFLRITGFISSHGISARVRKMFANAKRNIKNTYHEESLNVEAKDAIQRQASLLVLIAHVNEVTGVGVPTLVAEIAAEYLLFLLKPRQNAS